MNRIYINFEEIEEVIVDMDKKMKIILKPIGGTQVTFSLFKTDGTNKLRKCLCSDPEPEKKAENASEKVYKVPEVIAMFNAGTLPQQQIPNSGIDSPNPGN